jgi:hypothetical protein
MGMSDIIVCRCQDVNVLKAIKLIPLAPHMITYTCMYLFSRK